MKVIDMDDIKTYPIEFIEYAKSNNFDSYNKNDFNISYPDNFDNILNDYYIICYHCTRTKNINSFLTKGILINDELRTILLNDYNCDISSVLSEKNNYRGNNVQFVYSLRDIENDEGYLNFFNHVGGEIIEFSDGYDESKLDYGDCYVISFNIKGDEIDFKMFIIQKMIRFIKYNIPVNYHGVLFRSIKPQELNKPILANNIYNKLKEML